MNRLTWLRWPLALLPLLALCGLAPAQQAPDNFASAMVWRNIGPFRGGRVSAVTGAIGQPGVFYMGLPMGGVWKTTGAGTTWSPIFDSIKEASSVGAVEVGALRSERDLCRHGRHDRGRRHQPRQRASTNRRTPARHGSTSGWKRPSTSPRSSSIRTIPTWCMVAAQGRSNAKSDARGLYRSTDGGKTWKRTLRVDDETGVQKIAWAYDHPEVMLADHHALLYAPGQARGFGGGLRRPGAGAFRAQVSTSPPMKA